MNIQIFGKTKCFDTKKAERYFKERGIKYQYIDMKEKGMSKGELNTVCQAHPAHFSFFHSAPVRFSS
ncbi:arsenate reductase family protein, partial [Eisenbergiella porci]|uniref:arsenate reductase family protein n=1 Tax=Eisenbergiella porci TaxID=2652274 RepID=UPI002A80A9F7